MGDKNGWGEMGSRVVNAKKEQSWNSLDDSVTADAAFFVFLAIAILILIFIAFEFYERFLMPPSFPDLESQLFSHPKFHCSHQSPPVKVNERGVLVLMPGEEIPSFLANPAPSPPNRNLKPLHLKNQSLSSHTQNLTNLDE